MNTYLYADDSPMLLSIQMIADPLQEMLWEFALETAFDSPCLRSCQVYCGQKKIGRAHV